MLEPAVPGELDSFDVKERLDEDFTTELYILETENEEKRKVHQLLINAQIWIDAHYDEMLRQRCLRDSFGLCSHCTSFLFLSFSLSLSLSDERMEKDWERQSVAQAD